VSPYTIKECPQVSGSGSGRGRKYFAFIDRDSTFVSFSKDFLLVFLVFFFTKDDWTEVFSPDPSLKTRAADPDPYLDWIRIQSGQWIRIRIQESKNDPQKHTFFVLKFML
jgi:hypothetical protein